MPDLSIDELMSDPDFATTTGLQYRRTTTVVGDDGMAGNFKVSYPFIGIISPTSARELQRAPEGMITTGAITIITATTLSAGDARNSIQPDQVIWKGQLYIVKSIDDFTDWGNGFVSATCELQGLNT